MAKLLIGGRPSKEVLGRMKVVTVAVSVAAFLGSLGAIAGNGATAATVVANQADQLAFTRSTTAASGRSSAAATVQRPGFSAPLTRSRGS